MWIHCSTKFLLSSSYHLFGSASNSSFVVGSIFLGMWSWLDELIDVPYHWEHRNKIAWRQMDVMWWNYTGILLGSIEILMEGRNQDLQILEGWTARRRHNRLLSYIYVSLCWISLMMWSGFCHPSCIKVPPEGRYICLRVFHKVNSRFRSVSDFHGLIFQYWLMKCLWIVSNGFSVSSHEVYLRSHEM